jgi:hypothetical protein
MRQIWITLKRRDLSKKTAKEKGFKSEMYVLAIPHKLFKCLLIKPKTLYTLLLLLPSANSPPYKSTSSLFPKQTNNPKPWKSICCIIKFKKTNISKTMHIKGPTRLLN